MKKLILGTAFAAMMCGSAFAGNIGVSMANSDTFLTVLRNGIEAYAKEKNQPVTIEIADDDIAKQVSQVENFIASKVDAIIVNAVDTSATPKITKLAADAGIPLVYVNRQPTDVNDLGPKAAFVASNEADSGTLETKEICKILGGKGDILVMQRHEDSRRTDSRLGPSQSSGSDDQLDFGWPQACCRDRK